MSQSIQQILSPFLSEQWNDINPSDPGMTILESLAYVLSDLEYRMDFEMQDVLSEGGADPYETLYSAREILSNHALTSADYRKLLIDLKGVKNAFVEPVLFSDPLFRFDPDTNELTALRLEGLSKEDREAADVFSMLGLYQVAIVPENAELGEGNSPEKVELLARVWETLMAHRNLCEDFVDIQISPPQRVYVQDQDLEDLQEGDMELEVLLEIDAVEDIEELWARVYHQIAQYLSPEIPFYSLSSLLKEGRSMDQIFEGPVLNHGFIKEEELSQFQKRRQIRVSDLVQEIMKVPGVYAIQEMGIGIKKGEALKLEEWQLSLMEEKAVVLAALDLDSGKSLMIRLFRNGLELQPDVSQLKKVLMATVPSKEKATLPLPPEELDRILPKGEDRQLQRYRSVQYDLPETYGVGPWGSMELEDPVANELRKRQARQLKGYLLFLDQILGVNFSQLAHFRELMGFGDHPTYFSHGDGQFDVPALASIVPDVGDDGLFVKNLVEEQEENSAQRILRKHQFLDHLLARAGELIEALPFLKQNHPQTSAEELAQKYLQSKRQFLLELPELGANRNQAYDYSQPAWRNENVSGLKKRICRLLGFQTYQNRSLSDSIEELIEAFGIWLTDYNIDIIIDMRREIVVANILRKNIMLQPYNEQLIFTVYTGSFWGYSNPFANIEALQKAVQDTETLFTQWRAEWRDKDLEGFMLLEHLLLRPKPGDLPPLSTPFLGRLKHVDPYSQRLSFLFPDFLPRFQDTSFRTLVEQSIRKETPAHLQIDINWLDTVAYLDTERAYREWLTEKLIQENPHFGRMNASGRPKTVLDDKGEVHVFIVDEKGQVWCKGPELHSSPQVWRSLGGTAIPGSEVATVWRTGGFDVCLRTDSNAIHHLRLETGKQGYWQNLAGTATSNPSLVSLHSDHLQVLVRDENGKVSGKTWKQGVWEEDWSPILSESQEWMAADTHIMAFPSQYQAESQQFEEIALFVLGTENPSAGVLELLSCTYQQSTDTWGNWQVLPETIKAAISPTNTPEVLEWTNFYGKRVRELFFRNQDSIPTQLTWVEGEGWKPPHGIWGSAAEGSRMRAGVTPEGFTWLLVRGLSPKVYWTFWNGLNWSAWQVFAEDMHEVPDVMVLPDHELHAFARGTDNQIHHRILTIFTDLRPQLFWSDSNWNRISRLDLTSNAAHIVATSAIGSPGGIAIQPTSNNLYFTGGTSIFEAEQDGSGLKEILTDLGSPNSLALDPGTSHLYWTSNLEGKIYRGVLTTVDGESIIDPETVVELVNDLLRPSDILLDLERGRMYWTDYGTLKVQRANLDGSNLVDIIASGLERPRGIALNLSAAPPQLYIADADAKKILRSDLDGNGLEEILTEGISPYRLAIDSANGILYWSESFRIKQSDLDGNNIQLVASGMNEGRPLALNTATNQLYWTTSGSDKVSRIDLTTQQVEHLIESEIINPFGLAIDAASRKVYWAERQGRKIRRSNIDGSQMEDLLPDVYSPTDLKLDLLHGKMYWTNRSFTQIERANLDGSEREVVLEEGLIRPIAIALDVASNHLYWVDLMEDGNYEVKRANLDGTNPTSFQVIGPLGESLAIDPIRRQLYVGQGTYLRKVDLDDPTITEITTFSEQRIMGLSVDSRPDTQHIYWANVKGRSLYRANLEGENSVELLGSGLAFPYGIAFGEISVGREEMGEWEVV